MRTYLIETVMTDSKNSPMLNSYYYHIGLFNDKNCIKLLS